MDVDAQRYAKLRHLTTAAKRMGRTVTLDLDDIDKEVDAIDIDLIWQIERMHNFAEFVTLALNDAIEDGFGAENMGGTGIYQEGFYWRCLRELSDEERETCKQLVAYILKMPDYAGIAAIVGEPEIEEEAYEDNSVCLFFKLDSSPLSVDYEEGVMSRLLYGDLEIV